MRRVLSPVLLGAILAAALVVPVAAAKPVGACPNPAFEAMTYPEFRELMLELGVPEELLDASHEALFPTFDKNNDGLVCFMDLPDNAGTLNGWVFNAIDNTARAR
jgi:hypothetical protein